MTRRSLQTANLCMWLGWKLITVGCVSWCWTSTVTCQWDDCLALSSWCTRVLATQCQWTSLLGFLVLRVNHYCLVTLYFNLHHLMCNILSSWFKCGLVVRWCMNFLLSCCSIVLQLWIWSWNVCYSTTVLHVNCWQFIVMCCARNVTDVISGEWYVLGWRKGGFMEYAVSGHGCCQCGCHT